MIVRIREEAEAELEAAFDYYQARAKIWGTDSSTITSMALTSLPKRRNGGPATLSTRERRDIDSTTFHFRSCTRSVRITF